MAVPTDVSRRSAGSVPERGCSSKDQRVDDIDTFSVTPSPLAKRSKRINKNVKKQLLLKEDPKANWSKSEEEALLASDSDSSNTCAQDTLDKFPHLSQSEEESLLASDSDSGDTCAQEERAALEDALSEQKKGKKEKCPQCSKYLTRRTIKRHLKEGVRRTEIEKKNPCKFFAQCQLS
ncbi:uncharacterized protein LOC141858895 [Acropora palmata]|uniref:uncharacterized protein LOC141858895 n=1 Tax=Acropora palmata TaxID=6131 RepID=UPI003DA193DB